MWRPQTADGAPGQSWSVSAGNRFGKLGFVASATHSYKEQYIEEDRQFFRVESGSGATSSWNPPATTHMQTGTQKAQLGIVGNIAYQFTPNHRLGIENFYTHSGRDEGRFFEGDNFDNVLRYQNYRVQFIEEGMISNGVTGEHFFQGLSNSRFDWRANFARANRDEPDLREVLLRAAARPRRRPRTRRSCSSDESQSGFRMFNTLDDETVDVSANWAMLSNSGGRPTQFKFGVSLVDRNRDFQSRRFRFIPVILTKDGPARWSTTSCRPRSSTRAPTSARRSGSTKRRVPPTRTTASRPRPPVRHGGRSFSARSRLIAGARVEQFDQQVNTFDPFGLFVRTLSAENKNTDFFPSVNFVQAMSGNSNLRLSYGATVNRPEFRELASSSSPTSSGAGPSREQGSPARPDPQRRRTLGDVHRQPRRRGRQHLLQVLRQAHRARRARVGDAAGDLSELRQRPQHGTRAGIWPSDLGRHFFVNANYTFVESKITLLPEQLTTQTSLERPLAGQSKNLFNMTFEGTAGGFAGRMLFNFFGDRISDVGANDAPDILEQGREASTSCSHSAIAV